jgi:site-specific DNA-methyltransferase (adenine-specific)
MSPEPYYEDGSVTIYHGDCREVLADVYWPEHLPDAVVTDPPYGDTSLDWDVPVDGWLPLVQSPQVWCFGSMRAWMRSGRVFEAQGFRYGQEVVWEKHNGSGFNADRFKRVHEFAVHWYRGAWSALHTDPPVTFDATARTVKRRGRTPHRGKIGAEVDYRTEDGGPRLQRSVIYVRSENGRAEHPTSSGRPADA